MADPSDGGFALRYARILLDAMAMEGAPDPLGLHPALAWRRSGLMEVTGRADGPALVSPVALTSAADGTLAALRALCPAAPLPRDGVLLLGERARLLGLRRGGRISANGSCRLVSAQGGRLALNLPRADDWEMMPAWLEEEDAADWAAVERIAACRDRDALVARGRLLGLAVSPDEPVPVPASPFDGERLGDWRDQAGAPLVVDLSSLWAGPLAGALLAATGAQVVKVESRRRPDGARGGDPRFFDGMNAGKHSIALDFADPADIAQLRRLIAAADIVIEASRPRALAALGIDAAAEARRGATWVSITAHGRAGDAAQHIGFGDDAAVAGGLAAAMERGWGEPLLAGDAIADPLAGITAAFAAWAGWRGGGGMLVDVSLARVVAHACGLYEADSGELRRWQALAEADTAPLTPLREAPERARPLGADNAMLAALTGS